MIDLTDALCGRAKVTLRAARLILDISPDAAASRAYFSAYYALWALFALQDKTFKKHAALEAAVHRELVRPGIWPVELGHRFCDLVAARKVGEYGLDNVHVTKEEAKLALQTANDILKAVADANPAAFKGLFDC